MRRNCNTIGSELDKKYRARYFLGPLILTVDQISQLRNVKCRQSRVKVARKLAQLSQLEVASQLGTTQSYVSDVERRRYRSMTTENQRRFAKLFGCRVRDLFPDEVSL